MESNQQMSQGDARAVNRRRLIAGTLGASLAVATGIGISRAQDEAATPDVDQGTSPNLESAPAEDDATAPRLTAVIDEATEAITVTQQDRDAVAGQIDAQTVDDLLAQAATLRDEAQAVVDAADSAEAWRLAGAAAAVATAAGDLIQAQLTYPGLPSQETPASRILARTHDAITRVSAETAATTNAAETSFYVTTAEALYQTAYDQYSGGAYAQAAATARVAAQLTRIAALLAAPLDQDRLFGGRPLGRRRGSRRDRGPGAMRAIRLDGATDEPVLVPEPEF